MYKFLAIAMLAQVGSSQTQPPAGTWVGALNGRGVWGGLELVLSRSDGGWARETRVRIDGRLHSGQASGVAVGEGKISFQTMWEGREVRVTGTLEGDRFRGTFTMAAASSSELPDGGSLDLVRLAEPSRGGPLLPAATGLNSVGRSSFHWVDESREEVFRRPGKREIAVQLWYPAEPHEKLAPYLSDGERVLPFLPKGTAEATAGLQLRVWQDAPVLRGRRFPVIVFSPGKGVNAFHYSSLYLDLASHGFVVAAIDHPYDAPAVVFPGGRVVVPLPKEARPPQPSSDVEAQHEAADYRARDMLASRNALARMNAEPGGPFEGKLDLAKVSVAGHSLGGMAAFRACQLDAAIASCINIDGGYRARPYPAAVEASAIEPPFLWLRRPLYVFTDVQLKQVGMSRAEFDEQIAMGRRVLDGGANGAFDVRLPHAGVNHMDFSDIPLLQGDVTAAARAARFLTIEMTRSWVRDFARASAMGRPQRVLTETSAAYREARITAY